MPARNCLWCGDARVERCRGGYRCPDCGQFMPLPNRAPRHY